jgi:hypothetical protein
MKPDELARITAVLVDGNQPGIRAETGCPSCIILGEGNRLPTNEKKTQFCLEKNCSPLHLGKRVLCESTA